MKIEELAKTLLGCIGYAPSGVHAFLLHFSFGGRYIEEDEQAIEFMTNVFGKEILKHTITVFTKKDIIDRDRNTPGWCSFVSKLPTGLKETIKSCEGGVVAVSNSDDIDNDRNQECRRIISMVENVVSQNGGEDQYFRTEIFDEMAKRIDIKMNQSLAGNETSQENILQIREKPEVSTGEDQRQQLEELNNDPEEKLGNDFSARKTAISEIGKEFSPPIAAFGGAEAGAEAGSGVEAVVGVRVGAVAGVAAGFGAITLFSLLKIFQSDN